MGTDKQKLQKLLHEYMQKTGAKGGKARAKALSRERRRAIGRKAAKARWSRKGAKK